MGSEPRDNSGTPPHITPRNHIPICLRVGQRLSHRNKASRGSLKTSAEYFGRVWKLAQVENPKVYPVPTEKAQIRTRAQALANPQSKISAVGDFYIQFSFFGISPVSPNTRQAVHRVTIYKEHLKGNAFWADKFVASKGSVGSPLVFLSRPLSNYGYFCFRATYDIAMVQPDLEQPTFVAPLAAT